MIIKESIPISYNIFNGIHYIEGKKSILLMQSKTNIKLSLRKK